MALNPLHRSDLDLILRWRNDPVVRNAMSPYREISADEHLAWFERCSTDETVRCLLWHDSAGNPQGVVCFTEIDVSQCTALWSFYVNPSATPAVGIRMAIAALDYAYEELFLTKLSAEVLASNARCVFYHEKVGFVQEGCFRAQHFDGEKRIDVARFGMLDREWSDHRAKLQTRIAELDVLAAQHVQVPKKIVILSDGNSWMNESINDLLMDWAELGHDVYWAHQTVDLPAGDFCFCLSFGQLLPREVRDRFHHTLVVHESDLPQGKGWSPMTWQILEGKSRIPITLFEAAESVDSGLIYAQRWLEFEGYELVSELRSQQAAATRELCRWFVNYYPQSAAAARTQSGDESFYPRRRPKDSVVDPNKTIAEQFNLLRVVDNQRYPAFFEWGGRRYDLLIIRRNQ